jgi:type I restriction enzyme, S subunit
MSKSIEPILRMFTNGMGIPHVDNEFLKNIKLLLPELHQQKQIADYLDYETTQIDNLIAAKEQMLTLLEEKRAALIRAC